jgi:hypothetical protein
MVNSFQMATAGSGIGKNNPELQSAVGVGPIPRGNWLLTGVCNSKNTGPFTIALSCQAGNGYLRTFRI